jgi:hypothetical protein
MTRIRICCFVLTLSVLVACGSNEVLISKSASVPAGLDLSGQWLLRDTAGVTQPTARSTLVYVFLETGEAVKITQTSSALFISFDRSVVEEYRFGENREISVGEVTAARVSGWDGLSYVIETLDRAGAKLTDTYRLDASGRTLFRTINLVHKGRSQLSLEQTFDRV